MTQFNPTKPQVENTDIDYVARCKKMIKQAMSDNNKKIKVFETLALDNIKNDANILLDFAKACTSKAILKAAIGSKQRKDGSYANTFNRGCFNLWYYRNTTKQADFEECYMSFVNAFLCGYESRKNSFNGALNGCNDLQQCIHNGYLAVYDYMYKSGNNSDSVRSKNLYIEQLHNDGNWDIVNVSKGVNVLITDSSSYYVDYDTNIDVELLKDVMKEVTAMLSPRQTEMFIFKVKGYSNVAIADRLCISKQAVGKGLLRIDDICKKIIDKLQYSDFLMD